MTLSEVQREQGAKLAFENALRLCTVSGNEWPCCGYHGLWQYLRFMGVQPSISRDRQTLTALFHDALAALDAPRILITGAADYGLLELLHEWSSSTGKRVSVDIIDTCKTPLLSNEWFASTVDVAVTTHVSDVFEFTRRGHYDMVTTHSFIAMFTLQQRKALFSKWSEFLKPGGSLVTTTRLYTIEPALRRAPPKPELLGSKMEQLLVELASRGWSSPCNRSTLETLMTEIFLHRPTNEIVLETHLLDGLRAAGFELVRSQSEHALLPGVDGLVGAPKGMPESQRISFWAVKN